MNIKQGTGTVVVGGSELLADGVYHPMVRAYGAQDGTFEWSTFFDDRAGAENFGFAGFVNDMQVQGGRLLVGGTIHRADGGTDALVRQYSTP